MMLIGAFCTMLQCLGYAFLTRPVTLYFNTAVGMIGVIAPLACLAVIGHAGTCPSERGSLLGAANGLRAIVSSVAALALAFLLTVYNKMPPALAWPGSGFLFMGLASVVACLVAFSHAAVTKRQASATVTQEHQVSSIA